MARARWRPVIDYLRALALRPRPKECGDARLLERFVAARDEAAFAALVRRHGPMVFAVCRRALGDAHDAEDCFQAVFLVLARKAASLRNPERLSNFLYGVARRTAAKVRGRVHRRRDRERSLVDVPVCGGEDLVWRDLRPVLDEEIARLPSRYRTAVVLCYLEGATHAEAARRLGWPRGTVATRLAWARQRLRSRLTRRGITLPAGAVGALLAHETAEAALPAGLAETTVEASVRFAAAGAWAAGTTPVVILAKGVLHSMNLTKVQFAALMLLTAAAVGIGTGWLVRALPAGDRPQAAAPRPEPEREQGLREEIAALRNEMRELKKSSAVTPTAAPEPKKGGAAEAEPPVYQGKPASFWLAALRDRDPGYRVKAVEPLGGLAQLDRSLIPAIIDCLKDDDNTVRQEAANVLGYLGPPAQAAVPALLRTNLGVSSIVFALQQIDPKGEKAVPAALAVPKDADPHVRRNVAFTLLVFDKARAHLAIDGFVQALKERDNNAPPLPAHLRSKYRTVSAAAAWALGEMGPEAREAVPALVDVLRHYPDEPIPGGPANIDTHPYDTALKKIDPDGARAVPLLAKQLAADDGFTRMAACMALRVYGAKTQGALAGLLQYLSMEKNEATQCEIVRTIGVMGPAARAAVPDLFRLFRRQSEEPGLDTRLRLAIVWALGNIGKDAGEAVPLLRDLVKLRGDRVQSLRAEAIRALNRIDPEAAEKAGVRDTKSAGKDDADRP